MEPGPRDAITDVPGLSIGQAEDRTALTGTTVILPERPVLAAVDLRGGGPGTRETDAIGPLGTLREAHAIVLSGGSAYGLEAAHGAMDWLRARGRGVRIGAACVPIVPGAILFDLLAGRAAGEAADWETPPWRGLAVAACDAAGPEVAQGNAGAGLGAVAGRLKGGTGTASARHAAATVGALAVVNSIGSVVMPGSRCFWTWWLARPGEFGTLVPPSGPETWRLETKSAARNTTLAVVATDAALDHGALSRLAVMAQTGLARSIRPVHGPLDGDVVFAISTGGLPLGDPIGELTALGSLAADCLSRAVMRGVATAAPVAGIPAWRDLPSDPTSAQGPDP